MSVESKPIAAQFTMEKSYLLEPTYGYTRDGETPYKPTVKEVLYELLDTVDFVRKPRRLLNAILLLAHVLTLGCFVMFLLRYLAWDTLLFFTVSILFLCNVPHTLWYHRYCAHRPFLFAKPEYTRLFLWFNPLYTPEEHYAVAHQQHHRYAEHIGDPYGPHIGWLGSYFAIDSIQKLNTNISSERYQKLQRIVQHIGFKMASYEAFQRTGLIESLSHYITRTVFAQLFWSLLVYSIGGMPYLITWYGATWMLWFLLRDFGWRGHRGRSKKPGWEFHMESSATNQRFYGYLASEWHDNHHHYPNSANLAFLPNQVDWSFLVIKGLKKLGVIASYNDAKEKFDCKMQTVC